MRRGIDRKGPLTLAELRWLPGLLPETLVWYKGLPTWTRADEVKVLSDLFAPPPVAGAPVDTAPVAPAKAIPVTEKKGAGKMSKPLSTTLAILSCIIFYFIWFICFYIYESASVTTIHGGIYAGIKYAILVFVMRWIWRGIKRYSK